MERNPLPVRNAVLLVAGSAAVYCVLKRKYESLQAGQARKTFGTNANAWRMLDRLPTDHPYYVETPGRVEAEVVDDIVNPPADYTPSDHVLAAALIFDELAVREGIMQQPNGNGHNTHSAQSIH